MSLEPKRPVTLEDLLRLKRTERPPAEFWDQFDRELRAKQLAALVEKRPWWRSLPQLLDGLRQYRRYHLPLGATAVLAVTFFALRDRPATSAADAGLVAVAPAPGALVERREVKSDRAVAVSMPVNLPEKATLAETSASFSVSPVALSKSEAAVAQSAVVAGGAFEGGVLASELPASRSVSPNLLVAHLPDSGLRGGLLVEPGLTDAAPTMTRLTVEPLAQVAAASGGSRFARLRTAMASPLVNTVMHATDRVTRELSDERLSEDGIRRFAAKGDRLSVKF